MPEHQQIQQSTGSKHTFQKQAIPIVQTPVSNPAYIIQRARANPKPLTSADVLQLQRTIGNRVVGELISGIGESSTAQQMPVQRQKSQEEEEPLQGKMSGTVQMQKIPEDKEKLQMKPVIQRQEIPKEEEPIPGKMIGIVQRQEISEEEGSLQIKRENNTGLPDNLRAGVENLSGIDMSDVRVHYNSNKPAEVGALAYTQGIDIHVAPGQERHLPHETWHVVQQKQGKVKPTMQMKGVAVNDDVGLEKEADIMWIKALTSQVQKDNKVEINNLSHKSETSLSIIQRIPMVNGHFVEPTPEEDSILPAAGNPLESIPFVVKAQFDLVPPNTLYKYGEYRQYIRGAFRRNGEVQPHNLKSGQMSLNDWKEDQIGVNRYGYRFRSQGEFTDDGDVANKENGRNYRSTDQPRATIDDDEMDLHFKGVLVDTGDGNREIVDRKWHVYGKRSKKKCCIIQ